MKSFEILRATETSSKFEHGFIFDTNTTTYYYYILGYRQSDGKVVMVQMDRDLSRHSEALYIEMDAVERVSYYPKLAQACLIYKKGYGSYGEILNIYEYCAKGREGGLS